ncbi:MAG: hypothetical protein ACLFU4_00530 [Opitutales bacterium]
MTRLNNSIFTISFALLALPIFGEDLLLRLQPDASTPVVQRIVATEKVLLDADPVPDAPEWQQLNLELPLEGYVPTATLSKNFEIHEQTPVRFLPSANAFQITTIEPEDRYEIGEAEAEWTRITLEKTLTVYFADDRSPAGIDPDEASKITVPEPPALELPVDPGAADAGRRAQIRFDPDADLGTRRPDELPPENVAWKAGPRSPAPTRQPQPRAIEPISDESDRPRGIMVSPAETQAREERSATGAPAPNQPSRRLTGILVREIREDGPAYPVRLNAPGGRLIAYVDLSEIFINDLSPFIGQRVDLRGPIQPLRPGDRRLVLFARDIQLAE